MSCWIHATHASIFATLRAKMQHFHLNSTNHSASKHSCRSFADRKLLWKLNFFQLVEPHPSWDNILISIHWIDPHELRNRSTHARAWWKNASIVSMNIALHRLPDTHTAFYCQVFPHPQPKMTYDNFKYSHIFVPTLNFFGLLNISMTHELPTTLLLEYEKDM